MAENCPTGICGIKGRGINRILLAVDGSTGSTRAAEKARDMALCFGADVVIMHVLTMSESAYLMEETPAATSVEVEARLQPAINIIQDGKVMYDTKVVLGHPAEEILKVAENEEKPFQLIVIGSKGASRVERFLMGSVAQKVVQHSRIPVLVVP